MSIVAVVLAVFTAGAAHAVPVAGGTATAGGRPPGTYTNPVTDEFTRNFADPSMIRGRDGYWYGYATGGRHTADDSPHRMSIARSPDLVTWEFVGDVFSERTEPRYDGKGDGPGVRRMFWAPAVEYFGGRYLLYYSYVVNVGTDRSWRAIGVATAPTPAGPWTDSGRYVTGPETWNPRPGEVAWRNVIDPEVVTGPDGQRFLYYGSVFGGVRVVRLSADGLRATEEPVALTPSDRYEAAYVVRREGWYYLFLSVIGGCCAGPASAYPLVVARARSPLGPFTDRAGFPVSGRHAGGTPVQVPNGNRWVSVAHNTLATDVAGQDWLVTHGIDRADPYVSNRENARHLLINRLDWIGGWPVARAGAGLPDGAAPAPVAMGIVGDTAESGVVGDPPSRTVWRSAAGWTIRRDVAGGHLHAESDDGRRRLTSVRALPGDIRVRAAVRLEGDGAGRAGLVLADHEAGGGARAVIDRGDRVLAVEVRRGDAVSRTQRPLPDDFRYGDWHEMVVEVRNGRLTAEISDAGQYDPVAVATVDLPDGLAAGPVSLLADGTAADFDDVTAARAHTPVTVRVADPAVGDPDASYTEEFDRPLGPEWGWVRNPAAGPDDGELVFSIQQATLVDGRPGPDDAASVLLRQAPPGPWTAETKLTVPFADSLPYGWPRAGLVAYAHDDAWVNLGYGTRVGSRFAWFGRETTDHAGPRHGHAALGPTADTMWLRLRHTVDPDNGEHEYRAATSVDGQHWVWHGVRVLPAGVQPRVGLAAFDGEDDPTDVTDDLTARFHYLRFYRL